MNHLEQLISEWYEYRGYFVSKNTKVGKLTHGGFEGELDIVAYHPSTKHLVHVESSIDSMTWRARAERMKGKFARGRKYVPKLFPWLRNSAHLEQIAVLNASTRNHKTIDKARIQSTKELYNEIYQSMKKVSDTVPEHFPLLRTIQCVYNFCWCEECPM